MSTARLVDAARPLHDRVRRSVALALRDRVAGEDNAAKAAVIWDKPGERWFTESDPIWRVQADASMFAAGIRALLLQSLHPLAMAGVAGHSGYKGDPWGRLQRTSTFLATTTFGTIEDAEALIERIRGIHERVRGRAPDGRQYAASDPHLLKWVHIAEADSFLRPPAVAAGLTRRGDRYWLSRVCGNQARRHRPADDRRRARRRDRVLPARARGHAAARDAARFLLLHPPLPWSARPGYGALAGAGVALLPRGPASTWPALPAAGRAGDRPPWAGATSVIRWALSTPTRPRSPRHSRPSHHLVALHVCDRIGHGPAPP